MIAHIIGVDHAAHNSGLTSTNVERKLNDTVKFIENIISKMDNDTVLLVFGDHGITDKGTHGGSTIKELSSVLFSYSKRGFPVKSLSKKLNYSDAFKLKLNPNLK